MNSAWIHLRNSEFRVNSPQGWWIQNQFTSGIVRSFPEHMNSNTSPSGNSDQFWISRVPLMTNIQAIRKALSCFGRKCVRSKMSEGLTSRHITLCELHRTFPQLSTYAHRLRSTPTYLWKYEATPMSTANMRKPLKYETSLCFNSRSKLRNYSIFIPFCSTLCRSCFRSSRSCVPPDHDKNLHDSIHIITNLG